VEIYRPGRDVESLDSPSTLSDKNVLPGFVLDLQIIWECCEKCSTPSIWLKIALISSRVKTTGKRFGLLENQSINKSKKIK
jgi:hypothetical protein